MHENAQKSGDAPLPRHAHQGGVNRMRGRVPVQSLELHAKVA
jgi:hypothetical protein